MSNLPHIVGMVHLVPLPGSPAYGGSMAEVKQASVSDALTLAEAGFPALMIENFGDVPFHADSVPPETIAAMTATVAAVRDAVDLPVGVNVLRNDALAGVGVAAATGAEFIRVNVLTGLMYTDQGPIVGNAAEVMRRISVLAPDLEVWADVMVKHAAPVGQMGIGLVAAETVERGGADAIIVSGEGTGLEPDLEEARLVREALPSETRVVIGSGANAENLPGLAAVADSFIVGSSLKEGGDASNRVSADRAGRFMTVAAELGLA